MLEPLDDQHLRQGAEPDIVRNGAGRRQQRMAHLMPIESRSTFNDFGKRIRGVLIGIASQGAQGLELTDRGQAIPITPARIPAAQASRANATCVIAIKKNKNSTYMGFRRISARSPSRAKRAS